VAFVDALVRNRRPAAFRASVEDGEIMRAAIELRSARVEDMTPSPEFVDGLHDELRRQLAGDLPVEMPTISRRRWLLEGAIAASAAGVAVVVDRTVFASGAAQQTSAQRQLTPDEGTWHTVGERADLLADAVTRFSTPDIVGFVTTENGEPEALSGVCTHQGCLLKYNEADRRLDCPCHRAAFSLTGELLFHQLPTPPPPLPRLALRNEDGHVQIYLPPSAET
jgi:nitrite reductase/ring-hydroxylating ferredoxin subunit